MGATRPTLKIRRAYRGKGVRFAATATIDGKTLHSYTRITAVRV